MWNPGVERNEFHSDFDAVTHVVASPLATTEILFQRLPDRDVKFADAFDFALDLVAGDGRGDARGRSGHDDVSGRKLDHFGELGDDFRYIPDHLIEIAVLAQISAAGLSGPHGAE
jgi:hypothetical protein